MLETTTCATFEASLEHFLWYLALSIAATIVLGFAAAIVASIVLERPTSGKTNGSENEELPQLEALTSLLAIVLSLLSLPWWLGWVLTLTVCTFIILLLTFAFRFGYSKHISRAKMLVPLRVSNHIVRLFDFIRRYIACLLNWCNQGQIRDLTCLKELLGLPPEEREKRFQLICKLGNTTREMRNAVDLLRESDKARRNFRERVEPLSQLPEFTAAVQPALNEALQEHDKAVISHRQRVKELSQTICEQYRELHSHMRTVQPYEISIDTILAEAQSTHKEALQVF